MTSYNITNDIVFQKKKYGVITCKRIRKGAKNKQPLKRMKLKRLVQKIIIFKFYISLYDFKGR